MTKQNKLDEAMKKRNPLSSRQVVKPVDVLETEQMNHSGELDNRTDISNERTEQEHRSTEPIDRTDRPNGQIERTNRTVFEELQEGREEPEKRVTERYSFEIYTDQKGSIEEVQYLYKKRTGKKLSASRIIREALQAYLDKALQALRENGT